MTFNLNVKFNFVSMACLSISYDFIWANIVCAPIA